MTLPFLPRSLVHATQDLAETARAISAALALVDARPWSPARAALERELVARRLSLEVGERDVLERWRRHELDTEAAVEGLRRVQASLF